jgi:aldehyde dehydrogenase (NAD+)
MIIQQEVEAILTHLGVPAAAYSNGTLTVRTPITGEVIANVPTITASAAKEAIAQAQAAFLEWRTIPAPKRGAPSPPASRANSPASPSHPSAPATA